MKWPNDVDGDVSFTEKHGQYLSFISNYMKLNGRPVKAAILALAALAAW